MSVITFLESRRYFDKHCALYTFFSIGSKRSLETNISKEGYFPGDKRSWPTFPRITEREKPQRTICERAKSILTITVEVIRSFFWT